MRRRLIVLACVTVALTFAGVADAAPRPTIQSLTVKRTALMRVEIAATICAPAGYRDRGFEMLIGEERWRIGAQRDTYQYRQLPLTLLGVFTGVRCNTYTLPRRLRLTDRPGHVHRLGFAVGLADMQKSVEDYATAKRRVPPFG